MKDNRRQFMKKCLAPGAGGFVFSNRAVEVPIGARQPKIIYVLADDLGYGDLGCYGQKQPGYFYWEFKSKGGKQALRMGRWKGVRLNVRSDPNRPLELYDLDDDTGETTEIAGANPQIVSQIEQRMAQAHRYSSYFPFLYGE